MVDFRKGLVVHGGGAEGDIVVLDENLETKTSNIKIEDIGSKAIQDEQNSRLDALEESMGDVLDRLIAINGETE